MDITKALVLSLCLLGTACSGNGPDSKGDKDIIDSDSIEDSVDQFPLDAAKSPDHDGDGVSDNADAFPADASESVDSDGDGIGDNADIFPFDPSETLDSDKDGLGDNIDLFPNDPNETIDTDEDGVGNFRDVFPNDASESADTDGDDVGDNADAFPQNPSESHDSDGDGVGDNADIFPHDSAETSDTDGDGVGDNNDEFPEDSSFSGDHNGDGLDDRFCELIIDGSISPLITRDIVKVCQQDISLSCNISYQALDVGTQWLGTSVGTWSKNAHYPASFSSTDITPLFSVETLFANAKKRYIDAAGDGLIFSTSYTEQSNERDKEIFETRDAITGQFLWKKDLHYINSAFYAAGIVTVLHHEETTVDSADGNVTFDVFEAYITQYEAKSGKQVKHFSWGKHYTPLDKLSIKKNMGFLNRVTSGGLGTLDIASETDLWNYPSSTTGRYMLPPAFDEKNLYFSSDVDGDSKIFVIDQKTGNIEKNKSIANDLLVQNFVGGDVSLINDVLLVKGYTKFLALDKNTLAKRWLLEGRDLQSMGVAIGNVLYVAEGSIIIAVDIHDGSILWEKETGFNKLSIFSAIGDKLLISSEVDSLLFDTSNKEVVWSIAEIGYLAYATNTIYLLTPTHLKAFSIEGDNNKNSLPDTWEDFYLLSHTNAISPEGDCDGDGFNNLYEFNNQLSPISNDTDLDGVTDNDEIYQYKSNPNAIDTDGDGLSDFEEVELGTDLNYKDSDFDGWSDVSEIKFSTNPLLNSSTPDGYVFFVEQFDGSELIPILNAVNWIKEVDKHIGATLKYESISETNIPSFSLESLFSAGELRFTCHFSSDDMISNSGSIGTTTEVYIDGSLIDLNDNSSCMGGQTFSFSVDEGYHYIEVRLIPKNLISLRISEISFNSTADFDGDERGNSYEQEIGLNPFDPYDYEKDYDNDGLINGLEIENESNMQIQDTDSDELLDGEEVLVFFSSPLLADTDSDGLSDFDEAKVHFSNPAAFDSDGDMFYDYYEYLVDSPISDHLSYPEKADYFYSELNLFSQVPESNELVTDPRWFHCEGPNHSYSYICLTMNTTSGVLFVDYRSMFGTALYSHIDNTLLPELMSHQYFEQHESGAVYRKGIIAYEIEDGINQIRMHVSNNTNFQDLTFYSYDKDSDNDGLPDYWEEYFKRVSELTDLLNLDDIDNDGLSNLQEFGAGSYPTTAHSDDDNITDFDEVILLGTSATNSDTDNDGMNDNVDELPLDETESVDTDGDGIGNNLDDDDDNDQFLDINDIFPLDSSEWIDTDEDGIGNNADLNDDNDYLDDIDDPAPLDGKIPGQITRAVPAYVYAGQTTNIRLVGAWPDSNDEFYIDGIKFDNIKESDQSASFTVTAVDQEFITIEKINSVYNSSYSFQIPVVEKKPARFIRLEKVGRRNIILDYNPVNNSILYHPDSSTTLNEFIYDTGVWEDIRLVYSNKFYRSMEYVPDFSRLYGRIVNNTCMSVHDIKQGVDASISGRCWNYGSLTLEQRDADPTSDIFNNLYFIGSPTEHWNPIVKIYKYAEDTYKPTLIIEDAIIPSFVRSGNGERVVLGEKENVDNYSTFTYLPMTNTLEESIHNDSFEVIEASFTGHRLLVKKVQDPGVINYYLMDAQMNMLASLSDEIDASFIALSNSGDYIVTIRSSSDRSINYYDLSGSLDGSDINPSAEAIFPASVTGPIVKSLVVSPDNDKVLFSTEEELIVVPIDQVTGNAMGVE